MSVAFFTRSTRKVVLRVLLIAGAAGALVSDTYAHSQVIQIQSIEPSQARSVQIAPVTYKGRKALRVVSSLEQDAAWAAHPSGTGGGIVLLPGVFHNGTIELEVSGEPGAGAPADARGFVGVAFRVTPDASSYECVYIRPTNGRSDDQLRRNHSTQYSSYPNYEWLRLRTESPGKYESYVDLVPGEWTRIRIEVNGVTMRLYVNRASQPVLIVNDLKLGDTQGGLALWIGVGTKAYFSDVRISR